MVPKAYLSGFGLVEAPITICPRCLSLNPALGVTVADRYLYPRG